MIKYNQKYDRWVTEEGLIYRYDNNKNVLVLCKQSSSHGYLRIHVSKPKLCLISSHRLIWETFNGEIPDGMEIDHKDTHKENNALDNLILCTHKENCNNPKTREHNSKAKKGRKLSEEQKRKISMFQRGRVKSKFGFKFKEHFGITRKDDLKLYNKERAYWNKHNHKCRWEK